MMPFNTISKKITKTSIYIEREKEKKIQDLKNYGNEEKLNFKILPFQNQWITYMITQYQVLSFYFHVVNL